MGIPVDVGGVWKDGKPYVNDNGAWVEVQHAYANVNGTWKRTFTNMNQVTGGSITDVSNYNGTGKTYRVHKFTSNGSLSVTASVSPVRILMVAGGGAGAGRSGNNAQGAVGGSGGAGGVIEIHESDKYMLPLGSLSVTVGGGAGGRNCGGQGNCLAGGGGSTKFQNWTAVGGGGGGNGHGGGHGGSGGGGGSAIGNWGGPWGGGSGVSGQGRNGSGGGPQGSGGNGGYLNMYSDISGSKRRYATGDYGNRGGGGNWNTTGGSGGPGVFFLAYCID